MDSSSPTSSGHQQPSLPESDTSNTELNTTQFLDLNDPCVLRSLKSNDVLGREFDTLDEAEVFYEKYAKIIGFNVRKDYKRTNKRGSVTSRRWVCAKQGHMSQKWAQRPDRIRPPRTLTREGCLAAFKVNRHKEKQKWVVKEFVTDHTHVLASTFDIQYFRSHQHVQGLGSVQDSENGGDASSVGYIIDSDLETALAYLSAKKEMDPGFYFKYTIDENDRLQNLFWSDSAAHLDYSCFGDVVALDSKYKKNAYQKPLLIIVGANHHQKTSVFGFGLLADETVDCYSWLLETFLVAMQPKKPYAVITDSDKAMRRAIKKVLPECVHRLCCWDLERIAQAKVKDVNFKLAFRHCMLTNMTPDEFDQQWSDMVDKFSVQENPWVLKMYAKRQRWAETFLRGNFFGGMKSTKMSESMYAYLNHFAEFRLKLYEFVRQTDRALARVRSNEAKDDFESRSSSTVPSTHLEWLEKHAADVFTANVCKMVLEEIREEARLIISGCVRDLDKRVYTFTKFRSPHLKWRVVYRPSTKDMECSCSLFKTLGIPCSHSFSVMKAEHLCEIPECLIMRRWTKNAKVVGSNDFNEEVPTEVTELVRFGSLMAQCSKLCYYASKTVVGYNEAKQAICSFTHRMAELMTMDRRSRNSTHVPSKRAAVVNDPHVAGTKVVAKSHKQCNATLTEGDRCTEIGHSNAVSGNAFDVDCDSREYISDRLPIDKQCSVPVDFNLQVGGTMSHDSTVVAPTAQSSFGFNSNMSNQAVNHSSSLSPISPFNAPFADSSQ